MIHNFHNFYDGYSDLLRALRFIMGITIYYGYLFPELILYLLLFTVCLRENQITFGLSGIIAKEMIVPFDAAKIRHLFLAVSLKRSQTLSNAL
jgi:hypothetical protein